MVSRRGVVPASSEGSAKVEGVEEDRVRFDVVTTHTEAEPVIRGGDVRKARAVYLCHRPFHPSLPLKPFSIEVGLVATPVVEVPDTNESVEVIGEGSVIEEAEREAGVGEPPVSVLKVEERVEGILDGDEVECGDCDSGNRDGHVTAPHEPISFRAVRERGRAIRNSTVQPPVESTIGQGSVRVYNCVTARRVNRN